MIPSPKITAVGAAGAAATLATFIVQAFGVDVPADLVAPIVAILTFVAGWVRGENAPPGKHDATT